jgi:hypothetical protein
MVSGEIGRTTITNVVEGASQVEGGQPEERLPKECQANEGMCQILPLGGFTLEMRTGARGVEFEVQKVAGLELTSYRSRSRFETIWYVKNPSVRFQGCWSRAW